MANNNWSRICCVCRVLQPVAAMTRVVRVNQTFMVQGRQRLNGRGAHVCAACRQRPDLHKALNRSFRTVVPAEIVTQLQK